MSAEDEECVHRWQTRESDDEWIQVCVDCLVTRKLIARKGGEEE